MYIIIVGGGKMGYYLAKGLLQEGFEIVVVEEDAKKVDLITDELGSICLLGDGCETATLREAGAERANMLIATTDEDEDNLVACQVAKFRFNVPRTIARVVNPKNSALFRKLGIDMVVNPTQLVLEHIQEQLPAHHTVRTLPLEDKELELVMVRIPHASPVVGKRVGDLPLPEESFFSLVIKRGHSPQVPLENMLIEAEDHIVVVTKPELRDSIVNAIISGWKGK